MAFTTPGTAVAGEVLTAAFWNTQVRDNILMGNPVFTNEAARDAVITAPSEGQRAYLTAPTVPAATGASTFLPTGIQTIYNGSAWVCVTAVGAFTPSGGTSTLSSYTATLSGTPGTNPSVTISTGTTAKISLSFFASNSNANQTVFCSFAVSGATTIAAIDENGMEFNLPSGANNIHSGNTIILSGLTAGTNTFTLQYKVAAGTGTFLRRRITAQGIA
jgi:hypothetical protein